MNGNNSKIMVGTYVTDRIIGIEKGKSKFLKNSTSSNKFNITPKEKKIKRPFKTI